jgi:hypothetical protein
VNGPLIEEEVEALGELDLHQLRQAWQVRYGVPPKLRSPELLGLMLAWRVQADAVGGLAVETRLALRRPAAQKARPIATSGTKLAREWKGVRHEVTVTGDGGYLYQKDRYASLSQIARLITGARWNGPRFFGLRAGQAS